MPERVKKILPVVVLAAIGISVSIAIETVHRRLTADVNYASFCNVNASVNCDVVLGSRYASLAGLSVAIWAIVFYLAMLAVVVGLATVSRAQLRENLARLGLLLAVWGVLFSMYMAGIAFFVLHTICLMCSALYLVNISLFAAAWWLRSRERIIGRRQVAATAGRDRLVLGGSALAAVALLAIGSWEALGRGVQQIDAERIARERPDFYRKYLSLPVASLSADDGHSRGSATAPVTIVEFSDFECGHCAAFHESLDDVLPRLGQTVRVVFRHFPLDSSCNPKVSGQLHPQACLAAVASECAADQGKFWQYHDLLFANQQQLSRQFLIGYAQRLGLDVARFTECLGSAAARERVERDAREGDHLGIDSTPTVFINGRTVKGALDPQALTDAVTLTKANAKAP